MKKRVNAIVEENMQLDILNNMRSTLLMHPLPSGWGDIVFAMAVRPSVRHKIVFAL